MFKQFIKQEKYDQLKTEELNTVKVVILTDYIYYFELLGA